MSVGTEIKRRREEAGLAQTDLARAVGTSQAAISYFENGYKLPSLAMLCRIAEALGTTPVAILEAGTAKEAKA